MEIMNEEKGINFMSVKMKDEKEKGDTQKFNLCCENTQIKLEEIKDFSVIKLEKMEGEDMVKVKEEDITEEEATKIIATEEELNKIHHQTVDLVCDDLGDDYIYSYSQDPNAKNYSVMFVQNLVGEYRRLYGNIYENIDNDCFDANQYFFNGKIKVENELDIEYDPYMKNENHAEEGSEILDLFLDHADIFSTLANVKGKPDWDEIFSSDKNDHHSSEEEVKIIKHSGRRKITAKRRKKMINKSPVRRISQTSEMPVSNTKVSRKRKTSFEPPKLIDTNRDIFCWKCHKFGENLIPCSVCPRVFHKWCSHMPEKTDDCWVCDECTKVKGTKEIIGLDSSAFLYKLLGYVIQRLRSYPESCHFEYEVDPLLYPDYKDYVVKPVCISMIEINIDDGLYHNCHAFLADVKWMLHNSYIFNSSKSKFTTVARNLLRIAVNDCSEIELCPECYLHANSLSKDDWFTQPCSDPHLLVWAKLQGFPYWPGKVMSITKNCLDVRFFGDHNKAIIPVNSCYLYSKTQPTKAKITPRLAQAIKESQIHIYRLEETFVKFRYAPLKTRLLAGKLVESKKFQFPVIYEDESHMFPPDSISDHDWESIEPILQVNSTNSLGKKIGNPYDIPLLDPEVNALAPGQDKGNPPTKNLGSLNVPEYSTLNNEVIPKTSKQLNTVQPLEPKVQIKTIDNSSPVKLFHSDRLFTYEVSGLKISNPVACIDQNIPVINLNQIFPTDQDVIPSRCFLTKNLDQTSVACSISNSLSGTPHRSNESIRTLTLAHNSSQSINCVKEEKNPCRSPPKHLVSPPKNFQNDELITYETTGFDNAVTCIDQNIPVINLKQVFSTDEDVISRPCPPPRNFQSEQQVIYKVSELKLGNAVTSIDQDIPVINLKQIFSSAEDAMRHPCPSPQKFQSGKLITYEISGLKLDDAVATDHNIPVINLKQIFPNDEDVIHHHCSPSSTKLCSDQSSAASSTSNSMPGTSYSSNKSIRIPTCLDNSSKSISYICAPPKLIALPTKNLCSEQSSAAFSLPKSMLGTPHTSNKNVTISTHQDNSSKLINYLKLENNPHLSPPKNLVFVTKNLHGEQSSAACSMPNSSSGTPHRSTQSLNLPSHLENLPSKSIKDLKISKTVIPCSLSKILPPTKKKMLHVEQSLPACSTARSFSEKIHRPCSFTNLSQTKKVDVNEECSGFEDTSCKIPKNKSTYIPFSKLKCSISTPNPNMEDKTPAFLGAKTTEEQFRNNEPQDSESFLKIQKELESFIKKMEETPSLEANFLNDLMELQIKMFNSFKKKTFEEDIEQKDKLAMEIRQKVIGSYEDYFSFVKCNRWCKVCLKKASFYCCQDGYYCSQQCQEDNWFTHKKVCKQGEMKVNDSYLRLNPRNRSYIEKLSSHLKFLPPELLLSIKSSSPKKNISSSVSNVEKHSDSAK